MISPPRFETRSVTAWPYVAPPLIFLFALHAFVLSGVPADPASYGAGQNAVIEANPAPSPAQIHALMAAVVENQHHNEAALTEFERTERIITRKSENAAVESDRTNRLIPSGTGVTRFEIARDGVPIPRELYRQHLQVAIEALMMMANPSDREKQDFSKFERRQRERSQMVDATLQAFHASWEGRETRGSQTFAKFLLQPDPDFDPPTRLAEVFRHLQATLWVDESQKQIARIEGDVVSDVSFGGGIVGKLYRGGHFVIEQSEVAPNVWEPTLLTYDVDGRKLFVGFGVHERTENTHYRHLGTPTQGAVILREELNKLFAEAQ